jgi:hypothetical protein
VEFAAMLSKYNIFKPPKASPAERRVLGYQTPLRMNLKNFVFCIPGLAACCTCRFLRHFVPQKPRFMGCFGSLQGKKSPNRRFFGVLRARRNKLLALAFGLLLTGCEWTASADSYMFRFKIHNNSESAIEKVVFFNGTNRSALVLRRLDELNLTKGELSNEYKIFGFTREYGTDERSYAVLVTYEDETEIFAFEHSGHESKIVITSEDHWKNYWEKEKKITFSRGDW